MLIQKFQYSLLSGFGAAVRDVPEFCDESVVMSQARPHLMHGVECGFHSRHREELVLTPGDEQGRLGCCQGGDM